MIQTIKANSNVLTAAKRQPKPLFLSAVSLNILPCYATLARIESMQLSIAECGPYTKFNDNFSDLYKVSKFLIMHKMSHHTEV